MDIFIALPEWFVAADVPITKTNVKPGWVALSIVCAMGVALFGLVRSMMKHVKRAEQLKLADPEVAGVASDQTDSVNQR